MRYEDRTNSPGHPYAIGLTLEELSAFTTDMYGNRRFVTDTATQHWVHARDVHITAREDRVLCMGTQVREFRRQGR